MLEKLPDFYQDPAWGKYKTAVTVTVLELVNAETERDIDPDNPSLDLKVLSAENNIHNTIEAASFELYGSNAYKDNIAIGRQAVEAFFSDYVPFWIQPD